MTKGTRHLLVALALVAIVLFFVARAKNAGGPSFGTDASAG